MTPFLSIVTTAHPDPALMRDFFLSVEMLARELDKPVELVVVDDLGSAQHLAALDVANALVMTRVLSGQNESRGQASAIMLGLLQSKSDRLLSIDPDMASCLTAVKEMIMLSDQGYDVVIGRRKLRHRALMRAAGTYVFNLLISVVLGFRVHDLNSPMFMTNKRVVTALASQVLPLEAYKLKLFMDYHDRLIEVPVRDVSASLGVPSTYSPVLLASLFVRRLVLAFRLRVTGK